MKKSLFYLVFILFFTSCDISNNSANQDCFTQRRGQMKPEHTLLILSLSLFAIVPALALSTILLDKNKDRQE